MPTGTGSLPTGDPRVANIVSLAARLQAGGGIGEIGNPLDTTVVTVAAQAVSSIYLYETDALQIGTVGPITVTRVHLDSTAQPVNVAALNGVTSATLHAKVETIDGTLTVNNPVLASGNIHLAAGGATNDVVIDAAVTSVNGAISVQRVVTFFKMPISPLLSALIQVSTPSLCEQ